LTEKKEAAQRPAGQNEGRRQRKYRHQDCVGGTDELCNAKPWVGSLVRRCRADPEVLFRSLDA